MRLCQLQAWLGCSTDTLRRHSKAHAGGTKQGKEVIGHYKRAWAWELHFMSLLDTLGGMLQLPYRRRAWKRFNRETARKIGYSLVALGKSSNSQGLGSGV